MRTCSKRLPGLAREAIARGRERARRAARAAARSRREIALVEDDRPAARAAFERALAMDPELGVARLGIGQLLYVMADFAAAEEELARVPAESRHWGAAMRVRAAIAAARAEHEREAALWRALLDGRPDGDGAQSDRIGLGLCLAALGRRETALDAFRAAWQLAPDTGNGRYARERMTHLEAAPAGDPAGRAQGLPDHRRRSGTTAARRCSSWCCATSTSPPIRTPSPAIVKREHGTPMFEIVAYLGQMGVEARRIEASAGADQAGHRPRLPGHRAGGVLDQLARRGHHRLRRLCSACSWRRTRCATSRC